MSPSLPVVLNIFERLTLVIQFAQFACEAENLYGILPVWPRLKFDFYLCGRE